MKQEIPEPCPPARPRSWHPEPCRFAADNSSPYKPYSPPTGTSLAFVSCCSEYVHTITLFNDRAVSAKLCPAGPEKYRIR